MIFNQYCIKVLIWLGTAAWTRVLCVRAGLGWDRVWPPLHSSAKHSGSWFIVKFLFHHVVGCVVCINHFAVNKVTVRHWQLLRKFEYSESIYTDYTLHSTGWTRHRCSWALPTYHGTQHGEHTEVKLILYNYVLSAVSRVWLVSYISLLELQPDLGRALHQHNCQWGFLCGLQNLARICAYHTLASSGRG